MSALSPQCNWSRQMMEAIKVQNGGREPMVLKVSASVPAEHTRGFADPVPVSRFAECGVSGCASTVQFLSVNRHAVIALCEYHGHEVLDRNLGAPVYIEGPLGRILPE